MNSREHVIKSESDQIMNEILGVGNVEDKRRFIEICIESAYLSGKLDQLRSYQQKIEVTNVAV